MKQENAIEVHDLQKKFKVYHDKGNTLKERALHTSRNKYEERWVLKGISFEVKKGEAIGLVGHNGCGKSTTLKMLTKIMYPDAGTIELSGRVSSLLELGAGFHPDLSGRENIFINASIFGLTRKEIERRAEEIIRFSELEEFIDNPVRTYSSGMYMRLAFSVAISVDADILLIDEILGVGDANFQVKCFNKLMEIKNKGTTVVIVSHSLGQIEQICDRSIWIHDGKIRAEGAPRSVHREYLAYMGEQRNQLAQMEEKKPEAAVVSDENELEMEDHYEHMGSGEIKIMDVYVTDRSGERKKAFETAQDVIVHIKYKMEKPLEKVNFGVSIFRNDGVCVYGISTRDDDMNFLTINRSGTIQLELQNIALLGGEYDINVGIEDDIRNGIDYVDKACSFQVYTTKEEVGAFYLDHRWQLDI
ncbi:MAG: ABC transporter ATP-binding protein [Lachnospiraceae bacterium]